MTPALALLVGYSILMVAVGLWIGRRVRGGGDFFVAGRALSPALIFSTVLAANIGASSTVGATSIGYNTGLSAWWWNGSAAIGTFLLAVWIGPRMWREATRHGDLTVGDFLERHYGVPMRRLVAALIWVGTLAILAAQLLGIAAVLHVVGGVPRPAGIVLGAAVTAAYFVAGGLLSSAWVNALQLAVILAGFGIVAPLAVAQGGGWATISADAGSFLGGSGAPGWRYLFLLGPAFIVSPGLLQKAFGARDARAVTTGILGAAVVMLIFAAAPMAIGMSARALFPQLPSADLALPTMLVEGVHPLVGGLALAAVFSAEVSSADAVLFMLATSGARDLYRGIIRPQATDAELLRVARVAAIVGAVLGVGLSLMQKSVIDAVSLFYSLLVVVLFVPLLAALHVRVRAAAGLASVIVGVTVLLTIQFVPAARGAVILSPVLTALLASAVAFAASTIFARRSSI